MTSAQKVGHVTHANATRPAGNVRWGVCALLFGAIVLIYIHRNVVSVLNGDTFTKVYGWTTRDYGNINMIFPAGYAIGLLGAGRVLDKIGVRRGFLIAVVIWTFGAMAHGLISLAPMSGSVLGIYFKRLPLAEFMTARFCLGIVEGAFFPAAIRATAEWFPKKERALSTGIFNAGSALGALLSPLLVPIIAFRWGWPWAFYLSGGLGFIWIVAWLAFYREPEKSPRITPEELVYIRSDQEPPVKSLPWIHVIGHRQTWAFALGKFMTDPIWWFYVFWLPSFLNHRFHLDLKHFGPPLVIVYLMADTGSVLGGWLSSSLMRHGWTVNGGRKTAMLICALCVVPMIFAVYISNVWLAVTLIGLAAAAHQGWSANLFTLASDVTPKVAVSSVVGFGGMCGAIGGVVFQKFVGYIVDVKGTYMVPFVVSGLAYVSVLLVIQLMLPHLEPMELKHGMPSPNEIPEA